MIKTLFSFLIFPILFLLSSNKSHCQDEVVELSEISEKCSNCHAGKYYSFYNTNIEDTVRKRMNPYLIIDTAGYKKGVHRNFGCDDCHAYEYTEYPHPKDLKLEPKFSCIDCHGGDDTYAKYHFDEIEVEVENSVHKTALGMKFKCSSCHDIHSYKPVASDSVSLIKDVVVKGNQMCLYCHNDLSNYQVLTSHSSPELLSTHDWLPNQKLHFQSVRCIECHTSVTDTLMVSHNILPKDKAVHLCTDCHSTNTILSDKLYKYARKKSKSDKGYYNSEILGEVYVIGANRNRYINIASLIIIFMTIGGISVHVVMRILNKK